MAVKYRNIRGKFTNEKAKSILMKSKMKPESKINEDGTFIIYYIDGKNKSVIDKLIENKSIEDFEEFKLYSVEKPNIANNPLSEEKIKNKELKKIKEIEEQKQLLREREELRNKRIQTDAETKKKLRTEKQNERLTRKKKEKEEREERNEELRELAQKYITLSREEKEIIILDLTISKEDEYFKKIVAIYAKKKMREETLKNEYSNVKWKPAQQAIINIINQKPDPRKIYLKIDNGNTGKSFLYKYLSLTKQGLIIADGKKDNVFNQINDMCRNGEIPRIVILDVPRQNESFVQYGLLEQIKNGCIYSGKYEGGKCEFEIPHMFILSNFELKLEQWTQDRPIYINDNGELTPAFDENGTLININNN